MLQNWVIDNSDSVNFVFISKIWFISSGFLSVCPITQGGGAWWILCLSRDRRWEVKRETPCRLRNHVNKNRTTF